MTLIPKGVKVYVYADTQIKLLEGGDPQGTDVTAPSNKYGNVKDYYGDLRQAQQDLMFQPASIVGTTTGLSGVFEKTLYYQVLVQNMVDRRTGHGWGAGTYEKVNWYGWASSADITDSETVGLEKANKRTDQVSIEEIKKANALGNPNASVSVPKTDLKTATAQSATAQTANAKKSNTILYIGIGVVVIIGGVVAYFYVKKKKQPVQPVEQVPMPTMLY